MTIRTILAAGVYLVLVPLLGATGSWTEAMSATPFTDVQAPSREQNDVPIHGGRLERRDGNAGLQRAVDAVLAADQGPSWMAWSVPALSRPESHHDWNQHGEGRCVLDEDGEFHNGNSITGGTTTIVVLARASRGRIDRLTFTDGRCTVDAGTRTVYWIEHVRPAESVGLLSGLIAAEARSTGDGDSGDHKSPGRGALGALALHDDATAEAALERFVQPANARWLRRDAAFWLGASRGASGARVVEQLARSDADESFRQHLTFVLSLTGESGVTTLIDLARHDSSAGVRGQALFWLAQKAGQRATATLSRAVEDDPDREVRKRAVFAISQLPHDDAVPKLIDLARTHRDPEVRTQAMFWLGQSGDPRAVSFFESVLKQ